VCDRVLYFVQAATVVVTGLEGLQVNPVKRKDWSVVLLESGQSAASVP